MIEEWGDFVESDEDWVDEEEEKLKRKQERRIGIRSPIRGSPKGRRLNIEMQKAESGPSVKLMTEG